MTKTLVVKGKITKMYLDERYSTGMSLAVISYPDPVVEKVNENIASRMNTSYRKMVVSGASFQIGQEVLIKIESM